MVVSTRKSLSGFSITDAEKPKTEKKRRQQVTKSPNGDLTKKKLKQNTTRNSESKRPRRSPPSAGKIKNMLEDMSESSSRIVEDSPNFSNGSKKKTAEGTKTPEHSRTNSNSTGIPSLEPRDNSSPETTISNHSNRTSKSEDIMEQLSCTETMIISTTPDTKMEITELKESTSTSRSKGEEESSIIKTNDEPNITSPIEHITFKNDSDRGKKNDNNNASPPENNTETQVEDTSTIISSSSNVNITEPESNTQNIPHELLCRYSESLTSHISRTLKDKNIPPNSPLFKLLNDLKSNAKKIDKERNPEVEKILSNKETMLNEKTLHKERRIKLWIVRYLGRFKKVTEEHNKKCYYIYTTKIETQIFVDMPEIPRPATVVNSAKENLTIIINHLDKLKTYQKETLNLTMTEHEKHDSILNSLSNASDFEKHLAKHEKWTIQVDENREETGEHIKHWENELQESRNEIREQILASTLEQRCEIIKSKANLKNKTEHKNLKTHDERKPSPSKKAYEDKGANRAISWGNTKTNNEWNNASNTAGWGNQDGSTTSSWNSPKSIERDITGWGGGNNTDEWTTITSNKQNQNNSIGNQYGRGRGRGYGRGRGLNLDRNKTHNPFTQNLKTDDTTHNIEKSTTSNKNFKSTIDQVVQDHQLIHLHVNIQHKNNDTNIPNIACETKDIATIVNDTIQHLESYKKETLGEVLSCDFINTTQRNKNLDLFSTFNVKIQPNIPPSVDKDISQNKRVDRTISILDDYYSGQKITHLERYKEESKPHSSHSWARFTNIQVPCVNCREGSHRSYGLIIGLAPQIHGRHHKSCRWIIQQMFEQLGDHLDPDLNCNDHLLFRNKFGIRPGHFTQTFNKKTYHQAYHIHSDNDNNIKLLVGSFAKHAANEPKYFRIFNVRVTLSAFPKGKEIENKETNLCNLLSKVQKELSGLVCITIPSLKSTITEDDIKTIESQRELKTYSLVAEKGGVRAKLHLNKSNVTSHYTPKDFKNFLESPEEEQSKHNNTIQIETPMIFPEKKEEEESQQDDLLNRYLEQDDSISDIEIVDEGIKMYYAVAAGRETGVFTSWSAAQNATNGYSGVCQKKFKTRREAENFVRMNEVRRRAEPPTNSKQKMISLNKTYKEAAKYKPMSPTHSQTSENELITQYGQLTHSQQDPIPQEGKDMTKENKDSNQKYYAICPLEHHERLGILISMGFKHDVIKKAIEGWIQTSSAGFPKTEP